MERDKSSVFDDESVLNEEPVVWDGDDAETSFPEENPSAVPDLVSDEGNKKSSAAAESEETGIDEPDAKKDTERDEAGGETDADDDCVRNESGGRKGLSSFFSSLKSVLMFILSMLNPKNLFSGKMIPVDFVLNKWKTLLVVFCLLMFYISNRYSCQQKEERIGALRKEVEELRYKSLDMFVRLKRIQKEEAVLRQVRDSALDLHYPERPPYIILDKENGSE